MNLGPAQERLTPLAAQPKPTHAEKPANPETAVCAAEPSSVIALTARSKKAKAADVTADTRAAAGLVTVRPKPEKRKNAKERAKERAKEKAKDKPEATEVAAVNPEAVGLATAHPKPEKRKNAKERAKEKYTKDRTTPDTTAKAKSKVDSKAKSKAKTSKAAAKAA